MSGRFWLRPFSTARSDMIMRSWLTGISFDCVFKFRVIRGIHNRQKLHSVSLKVMGNNVLLSRSFWIARISSLLSFVKNSYYECNFLSANSQYTGLERLNTYNRRWESWSTRGCHIGYTRRASAPTGILQLNRSIPTIRLKRPESRPTSCTKRDSNYPWRP